MSVNYLSSVMCLVLNFYLVHGKACQTYPAGVNGSCIAVQDCPRLNALWEQVNNETYANTTLNALWEQVNNETDANTTLNALWEQVNNETDANTTLTRSMCSLKPQTFCCESPAPESKRFSPRSLECGSASLVDFVVGGGNAAWWPWMVLLIGKYEESDKLFPFCGGTLISDRFVITAAHCKNPRIPLESARARIGELIISTNPDTYKRRTAPQVQDIRIAEFISHPQYQQGCERCNDIAIIWLAEPVKMKFGYVEPVCLPLSPEQQIGLKVSQFQGNIGSVAGWGRTNPDPSISSQADHLQQIPILIGTTKYCKKATSKHPAGSTLCAGEGNGKDTCKGDSGGPLVITNAIGTRNFLIGVTSFGSIWCGVNGTQGMYISVHHYIPWILKIIYS